MMLAEKRWKEPPTLFERGLADNFINKTSGDLIEVP
jgi:hypothetical protein